MMKQVLSVVTLLFALASPAQATSDSYYILNGGKILYDHPVPTLVGDRPMQTQEVGVTYKGNIYVCQITFSIVFPTSEVKCFNVEDKGLYSVNTE